jgi:hypothetical protein
MAATVQIHEMSAMATGVDKTSGTFRFKAADNNTVDTNDRLQIPGAGSIVLADNEFAYVDLNETNNTALTAAKAAVTTGAASNFKSYNRLVLGYRNTLSDNFYPVHLKKPW